LALGHEKANVMSATHQDPDLRKDRSDLAGQVMRPDVSPMFIVSDASEAAASQSPARAMQGRLSRSFGGDPTKRWSGRTTLLFIIVVCGGFWSALFLALAAFRR
jgi:hypothetical protein